MAVRKAATKAATADKSATTKSATSRSAATKRVGAKPAATEGATSRQPKPANGSIAKPAQQQAAKVGTIEPTVSYDTTIHLGVGGWTFEPWRDGTFFPKGLAQSRELEYATRRLTAIEINGTYYGTQSPASFRKWHDTAPAGFRYAVKAPRVSTNRRVLAEAGESIGRFVGSGLTELGDKLGPILWQFANTKKFDAGDFGAFLALLPHERDGLRLRHALEVRHPTFEDPAFVQLARDHGCAIVYADVEDYPSIADLTTDFVYARLMRSRAEITTGYAQADIAAWAARLVEWSDGGDPRDLPHVGKPALRGEPRAVYAFVISGAKERAPAGAQALIAAVRA